MVVRKKPEPEKVPQPDKGDEKKFNVGDRVMYRGATWYIKADRGGSFVVVHDLDSKHVQSVPRITIFKWHVMDAGDGPPLSEAERRHSMPKEKRRQMEAVYAGAQEVIFNKKQRQAVDLTNTNGEKRPKQKRESKPINPNAVPLKTVCKEANVDPKIARRLLRADKTIPRPDGRWEFDRKDLERIKKIITQPIK